MYGHKSDEAVDHRVGVRLASLGTGAEFSERHLSILPSSLAKWSAQKHETARLHGAPVSNMTLSVITLVLYCS